MQRITPKKKWRIKRGKEGVSEVVGNLLILAITVTLFSSVLWYVTAMPTPNERVYADFSSKVVFEDQEATISVTHMGGQTLKDFRTSIYLFVDGEPVSLNITDGIIDTDKWETGKTWTYTYSETPVTPSTRISMMIVDTEANTIVWDSILNGEQGNFAPIIKSRGIKKANEPVNTPYYAEQMVQFYAQVVDPDGDLDYESVWVNAASINETEISLTFNPTLNMFVSSAFEAKITWHNKVVVFYASDHLDHVSSARAVLSVTLSPTGGGGGGGGGGEPPGNLDYGALQGFGIFEWEDWEENSFSATPRKVFERGEVAVVVVASKYVVNFLGENTILVLNETTKVPYEAVSSPNNRFVHYDVTSGYYVYNCSIDTAKLPDISSHYLVNARLQDSGLSVNHVFQMNARLYVFNDDGSSTAGYPQILTFKDSGFSIQSSQFTTYNPTNNKIYVEIRNNQGAPWDQFAGDVEVRDFFWNYQIRGTPKNVPSATGPVDWNGPISNLWQVESTPPPGVYRFVINLANATYGTPWIPGENSYVLRYDMFKAGPETYVLNKLVKIDAPNTKLDIVVGGEASNTARFTQQNSLYFYTNDNNWSPPYLLETTNDKTSYNPIVHFTRAGDINGDGRTDFVAILQVGSTWSLYAYMNQLGGGWTKSFIANLPAVTQQSQIKGLELGNIDFDDDLDIVVAYNNAVYLYRNDGAWTRTTVNPGPVTNIMSLHVADMDAPGTTGNDPKRSQDIITGHSDGTITIFKNQFGDGSSWIVDRLTSSGTATVYDYAIGEESVIGTVIGNYTSTQNPHQDDGVYQQITENITWNYNTAYPTIKGSEDNIEDDVGDLQPGSATPYTVLDGKTAQIVGWDNSGMDDALPFYSAQLEVRYRTTNHPGGEAIQWNNEGTIIPIITISDTNGEYVNATYDLSPYFTYASPMVNLNLTFSNSVHGSAVDFDYWRINVTWKTGDQLEHIWEFDVTPAASGTNHQFNVYAVKSTSTDNDNFQFYYSTDKVTWNIMNTCLVTNTGVTMSLYSFTIPGSISGQLFVKVVDTNRDLRADPSPDWIKVGQMRVVTTAASTSVGTSISAMTIGDVDGNGANDIVVVSTKSNNDQKGQVFVLYNRAGGILSSENIQNVVVNDDTIKGGSWVGVGKFFNPYNKPYLDIMIGLSPKHPNAQSLVYVVNQTALGSFSGLIQLNIPTKPFGSNFQLVKMIAADIDGNQRTDLLFGTNDGFVIMFANYGGTTNMSGWQMYQIDQLVGSGGLKDMGVTKFP